MNLYKNSPLKVGCFCFASIDPVETCLPAGRNFKWHLIAPDNTSFKCSYNNGQYTSVNIFEF